MSKPIRRVHIDGDEWKWSMKGQRSDISIYSPYGRRFRVDLEEFLVKTGHCKDKDCADYCVDNISYTITPAAIKAFIEKELIPKIEHELLASSIPTSRYDIALGKMHNEEERIAKYKLAVGED